MSSSSEGRRKKLGLAAQLIISANNRGEYISCFMGKVDLRGSFTIPELEAIVYLAKANKLFTS